MSKGSINFECGITVFLMDAQLKAMNYEKKVVNIALQAVADKRVLTL